MKSAAIEAKPATAPAFDGEAGRLMRLATYASVDVAGVLIAA